MECSLGITLKIQNKRKDLRVWKWKEKIKYFLKHIDSQNLNNVVR